MNKIVKNKTKTISLKRIIKIETLIQWIQNDQIVKMANNNNKTRDLISIMGKRNSTKAKINLIYQIKKDRKIVYKIDQ